MNAILPLDRIRETDRLVAFYHPKPAYPTHVLIVPKQAGKSLLDLAPKDRDLLAEVVELAQQLVRELDLAQAGYRLIVNGGAYQDVAQLHFHLVSDTAQKREPAA